MSIMEFVLLLIGIILTIVNIWLVCQFYEFAKDVKKNTDDIAIILLEIYKQNKKIKES